MIKANHDPVTVNNVVYRTGDPVWVKRDAGSWIPMVFGNILKDGKQFSAFPGQPNTTLKQSNYPLRKN